MSQVEGIVGARGKIMVVDDNPDNLKLLEDMLRQKGYDVRSFPRGRLALTAAAQNCPDLILLDVNMPELNGYEVCESLKSSKELAGVPVLFLSAADQPADKVKGFRSGAVDYISKPFHFEEVYARVETHLKLQRMQQVEQELLEETLNGTIRMLSDLVHLASPEVAARSRAIRDCVARITQHTGADEPWRYDLAATLCLLGCVALPHETFHKGYAGHNVSREEDSIFRAHPESAARLLANIPRLGPIADMIRLQQAPDADQSVSRDVKFGARMLFLAIELDRRIYRGVPYRTALDQLKKMPGSRFDSAMLDALEHYSYVSAEFRQETVHIRQLYAGMVLDEDVIIQSTGLTIFRKGTILTDTWIERLDNFSKFHGVRGPLRVRVLGQPGAPVFRGASTHAQRS